MSIDLVMPVLGLTVEKGKILRWLKSEGDTVQKGESLFEIEADKVATEVEAPGSGVLKEIIIREGIEVPVLTVVGVIAEKGNEQIRTSTTSRASRTAEAPVVHQSPAREHYDVVIVGGGTSGYAAANRAARLGANVLLVERDELGGDALRERLISVLSDAKTLQKVRASDVFNNKVQFSLDYQKVLDRAHRVSHAVCQEMTHALETLGVTVVKGVGTIASATKIEVRTSQGTQVYHAGSVVVATGSQARQLPNILCNGTTVLTSDDGLTIQDVPRDLIIIGGGASGAEYASLYRALGAKVTIVEMLPRILPREDEEISERLRLAMERDGISVVTRATALDAASIDERISVRCVVDGKDEKFEAQTLLVAVGRDPNTEGLGLDKVGVRLKGRCIDVNTRMETNVAGLYAVGGAIGKSAHAAWAEGITAVENIRGKPHRLDYHNVPHLIFTLPEIASVGATEVEAKARGKTVRVGKSCYSCNGKALAIGERDGFAKVIADKALGEILGVHILGEGATDLIGECALGMAAEITREELMRVVKGRPTLSEIVTEAALNGESGT